MKSRAHTNRSPADVDAVIKLLLLGDGAVGKSSLLLRYCEDKFDHKHILTIGVDFKSKIVKIGHETVRLQIWDTAGQERFRNITPVYFRSAMGVILVFDVTSQQSFENVSFWLESLALHAGNDISKIIVGNKVDLVDARQVSKRRAEALAAKHGLEYFEASALSNIGVQEIFEKVARDIRQKHIKESSNHHTADDDNGKFQLRETMGSADGVSSKSLTCCGFQITKAPSLTSGVSVTTPQSHVAGPVRSPKSTRKSRPDVLQSSESDLSGLPPPTGSPRFRIIQKSPIYVTTDADRSEPPHLNLTGSFEHLGNSSSPNSRIRSSAGTVNGFLADPSGNREFKSRRSMRAPESNAMFRLPSHMKVSNDFGKRVNKCNNNDVTP